MCVHTQPAAYRSTVVNFSSLAITLDSTSSKVYRVQKLIHELMLV